MYGTICRPAGGLGYAGGRGSTYEADSAEWARLIKQLHGWAVAIQQATEDATQATSEDEKQNAIAQVQIDRSYFRATLDQLKVVGTRLGNRDFTAFDRFILNVGNWIDHSVQALPGAIAAIPKALIDAIADVLSHAGGAAVKSVLPWVLGIAGLAALVIFGAKQAEQTRTYRRYVA